MGKKEQNPEQKADMDAVWGEVKGAGVLDFVTAWYLKAAQYITATAPASASPSLEGSQKLAGGVSHRITVQNEPAPAGAMDFDTVPAPLRGASDGDAGSGGSRHRLISKSPAGLENIRVAFVSTNSISQGEQVSVLWGYLLSRYRVKIHFAHRTFPWESEARGKAHVHVVIIGFGLGDVPEKRLYDYDHDPLNPSVTVASNISPYLIEGSNTVVTGRTRSLSALPEISYGSMMIDKDRKSGDEAGLILSSLHRQALLAECPDLAPFIRRLYGGEEFLNGAVRYCLWLVGAPPSLVRNSPMLRARIETVRKFRESSGREQTKNLANTPTLFGEIRQPNVRYLLIPKVSSETRHFIPIGFVEPDIIASGSALIVPGAELFHFGVLSSTMHNAWMRLVAGRLESRFQYSNAIVYNNYPWPEAPTRAQRSAVERAAQRVLDACAASTLADLYDPLAMPPALAAAHTALDKAVDRCYRSEPFPTARARVEHLLALYEKLTAPLAPTATTRRKRAKV